MQSSAGNPKQEIPAVDANFGVELAQLGRFRRDPQVDIPGLKDMAASMTDLAKAVRETPAKLKEEIAITEEAAKVGYQQGAGHGACGGIVAGMIIGFWVAAKIFRGTK
jgi:hypothetical protein